MNLDKLEKHYFDYVDTFREGGELKPMMELKRFHTLKVVENAKAIAAGEGFSAHDAQLSYAAALLHDTGRYEQLKRYNTFKDSESVDHAVFSHDIVKERGWLEDCGFTPEERDEVLKAVLYHNRRDLPEEAMKSAAAKSVRDADKLDIFRVLEDRIENTDWRKDSTAFWSLRYDLKPNPEVIAAIREGRPVDYQNIKSLADFILIQVGWLKNGLYFATSRTLAEKRGHFEFRRRFILDLINYDIKELGENFS